MLADGRRVGRDEPIATSEPDPAAMVAGVGSEWHSVLRRAAIEKVGGWDESLQTGQDRDLFLTLVEAGWSFAKLPTTGFTRLDTGGPAARPDRTTARADGIRIAEKHRDLSPPTSPPSSVPTNQPWPKRARLGRPAVGMAVTNEPCTT